MVSNEEEPEARVELAEIPSGKWGWSKINHRTWHVTGLVIVAFLLANVLWHTSIGHIEDWYLVGFAALVLFVVGRDWWGRRRGWLK